MDTPARAATRLQRDGAAVQLGEDPLRVSLTFCTPRIVRVELLGSAPDPGPSFVVPRDWPAVPIEVHDGEPARLGTPDLGVEVTTSPVTLAFLDAAGNWLLREPADGGMEREQGASGRARVPLRDGRASRCRRSCSRSRSFPRFGAFRGSTAASTRSPRISDARS